MAPSVHETRGGADRPVPLPPAAAANVARWWNPAWKTYSTVDGVVYGVPFGANVKSLVWYSPKRFKASGYAVPTTWRQLMDLSRTIARNGQTPWCGGLDSGDSTGWPATDWLEEIVLGQFGGEVYDSLGRAHDQVPGGILSYLPTGGGSTRSTFVLAVERYVLLLRIHTPFPGFELGRIPSDVAAHHRIRQGESHVSLPAASKQADAEASDDGVSWSAEMARITRPSLAGPGLGSVPPAVGQPADIKPVHRVRRCHQRPSPPAGSHRPSATRGGRGTTPLAGAIRAYGWTRSGFAGRLPAPSSLQACPPARSQPGCKPRRPITGMVASNHLKRFPFLS